jgi:hypothetical protein
VIISFTTNSKPYQSFSVLPIRAFHQAADRLCPTDPERKQRKVAAHTAPDYLAAECAFQSFAGTRIAPVRRNLDKQSAVSFYARDYAGNIFGVLTGACVFLDAATGPYRWERIDQESGVTLW